jgi:hypothetical protein
MRNWLVVGALVLGGCGGGGIANRERPDEFAVGRQAPLVIPPDFTLKPPAPGSPRPLAADSQQQALEALFGPGVVLPPKSSSELSMIEDARAQNIDPMIRSYAGEMKGPANTTQGVDKGAFLREILDAPAGVRNPALANLTIPGA